MRKLHVFCSIIVVCGFIRTTSQKTVRIFIAQDVQNFPYICMNDVFCAKKEDYTVPLFH